MIWLGFRDNKQIQSLHVPTVLNSQNADALENHILSIFLNKTLLWVVKILVDNRYEWAIVENR